MPDEYKTAYDSYAIDAKYTIDPETGFLHLPLKFAKVGIMEYSDPPRRRYLSPEVLKAAVRSMDYNTVTRMHDGGLVTTDNIDFIGKGIIKEGSNFDGTYGRANAIIQVKDLIDDILSKKITQTSSGYKYKNDGKPGRNEYGEFDISYTFIKYNHVSAVSKGRAGNDVKFELDKKGEKMGKIKKKLSAFKIGMDQLLDTVTITYTEENESAMDAMSAREEKLMDIIKSQADNIQTMESSLTANKESLDTIKKAQDGLIKKTDVKELAAELLDAQQVAVKVGLDCKEEIDTHIIKQKIVEKMLPNAFKSLKEKKLLESKKSVNASYDACKENLGFHQEVHNTQQALDGNQGRTVIPVSQPKSPLYNTLEHLRR